MHLWLPIPRVYLFRLSGENQLTSKEGDNKPELS